MTINSDIRDHAYQFFIQEAPDLLQVIESGLLTLRQEKTTPKVHDLMRAAHSLKGGSASVGLAAIEALAHRLETIFKALYSDVAIDTELEGQLLQAYDCLRLPLTEQVTTGYFNSEQALAASEPIFAQIEERLGEALTQADVYLPSSTELGINMAMSIFEVDVGQGLEHLAEVAAHAQDYEVAGELRAQADVFSGFAELLNQQSFGTIAQLTLVALDAHPESALEILQLAIADFGRCRQAVLTEDLTVTISPSAALVAFADVNSITASDTIEPPSPVILLEDLEMVGAFPDPPSEETWEEMPSLEDVFGDFFATADEPHAELETTEEVSQAQAIAPPETLELAVQSIEQIFDSLPPLEELPAPTGLIPLLQGEENLTPSLPPQEEELALANPTQSNDDTPVTSKLTVRVDSERLERMNNLVGELSINRNGLSLQNEQLQGSVRELRQRYAKVQNLVGHLRQRSDTMVVGHSNRSIASHSGFLSAVNSHSSRLTPPISSSLGRTNGGVDNSQFDSLELDSYDALHSQLQELLEDMMQLEEAVEDITLFAKATDKTLAQQRQNMTQLRDELMWARMLPLGEILNRFPRILRELSTTYDKPVSLKLSGTGVLVDKAVLEKLYDPLLHLLRNAFDHGIEAPEIRRQHGKPEQGQIQIRAYHKGSQTIIEVRDDGQGLNLERIRQRVLELNWLSTEQLAQTSNARLSELIFEPRFSTASLVSELSGRGVGLDVVRLQLRSLKGTVTVTSSPGQGTTFTLKLPLTLTIANLLICLVGKSALAFPADSIEEIVIPTNQIQFSGVQRFLSWQEQLVPVYELAELLDYACPLPQNPHSKALVGVPSPEDWEKPLLVMRLGSQVFALEVERLVTEQELVIKSFGEALAPPSFTYGCTILGDGSLVPVIDAALFLETVIAQSPARSAIAFANPSPESLRQRDNGGQAKKNLSPTQTNKASTVLVVDDAVALRRTLALTLERAGFRVLQAPDGREAIKQLQQTSTVDLVVCDIEMPNMNGFEFLSTRRQEPQLSAIPIVMLTSRSNEKHRRLAMQLGASAYFTKPYIEQEFVKAIKDILHQRQQISQ